jgi:hypothetical protein
LPLAKAANWAEPLILAVAPVKIRVGGWGEVSFAFRRRGSERWAK